jgi:transposase
MSEPLIRRINREQMCWRAVDVERLIEEEHPARAIWDLIGRLDLSRYYARIQCSEDEGGRPAIEPRLLISLWIYGYSLGIGSARELARRCQWDPAFQWLTGCDEVNYHTLSSFRVEQREELDDLFTQVLGLMSAEGLITLEQVVQDGTKIKAQASSTSFQGEARMQEHLERARQRVREMGEPDQEAGASRVEQARWRAGRERQERLERGLEELQKRAASKPGEPTLRVSVTDPDARKMKQPDGGFAPSYNVQICADAAQSVIVDVQVTQAGNDSAQLLPGLERIEARMGRKPLQMMADGDYTNRRSIEAMAEVGVDYLGSLRPSSEQRDMTGTGRLTTEVFLYDAQQDHYVCPQGMLLRYRGVKKKPSGVFRRYQAAAADCQSCPLKPQCCPGNQKHGRGLLRGEESAALNAFRQKMATREAQQQYRARGRVIEFCHAWIKSKLGLRQFHLRGRIKAQIEALWACLTYNLQQWIRLSKQPTAASLSG